MLPEVDERRNRIREDLAPLIRGEIRCDPLTVALYATDGSLYEVAPLGVVTPRDAADVAAVVRFAASERIPLIARGAGSGLAGESLGHGLIIDFSRHMRRIEEIGTNTVRVQPGVVCSQLNRQLRLQGRYFPPDPSNAYVTTIGSMLALDAAGSHSIRIGSTRDHVESVDVVLASGQCATLRREQLSGKGMPLPAGLPAAGSAEAPSATEQPVETLLENLASLLERSQQLIDRWQPPMIRNRCGYYLRGVLSNGSLDMPRLLVGSEGTLALFTAATLHTMPLPAHRGVVLLVFPQLELAVRAVQE
ncbi:MAG: FAD-binding oxidoreductase, partial [Planctomycetaceae bacterium]